MPEVPSPASQQHADDAADTRSVAVVIPIPDDPPWELFDAIPPNIPIIVSDDSDGKLSPPPRDNVWYFDYAAQRGVLRRALRGHAPQERGQSQRRPLHRVQGGLRRHHRPRLRLRHPRRLARRPPRRRSTRSSRPRPCGRSIENGWVNSIDAAGASTPGATPTSCARPSCPASRPPPPPARSRSTWGSGTASSTSTASTSCRPASPATRSWRPTSTASPSATSRSAA